MRDLFGVLATVACALHCGAALLLAAGGGAGLALLLHSEWTHVVLLVIAGALALSSFPATLAVHRRWSPLLLGGCGILFLAAGVAAGEPWELSLTATGGALAAVAHLRNRFLLGRLAARPA